MVSPSKSSDQESTSRVFIDLLDPNLEISGGGPTFHYWPTDSGSGTFHMNGFLDPSADLIKKLKCQVRLREIQGEDTTSLVKQALWGIDMLRFGETVRTEMLGETSQRKAVQKHDTTIEEGQAQGSKMDLGSTRGRLPDLLQVPGGRAFHGTSANLSYRPSGKRLQSGSPSDRGSRGSHDSKRFHSDTAVDVHQDAFLAGIGGAFDEKSSVRSRSGERSQEGLSEGGTTEDDGWNVDKRWSEIASDVSVDSQSHFIDESWRLGTLGCLEELDIELTLNNTIDLSDSAALARYLNIAKSIAKWETNSRDPEHRALVSMQVVYQISAWLPVEESKKSEGIDGAVKKDSVPLDLIPGSNNGVQISFPRADAARRSITITFDRDIVADDLEPHWDHLLLLARDDNLGSQPIPATDWTRFEK